jgi:hypothetical protein
VNALLLFATVTASPAVKPAAVAEARWAAGDTAGTVVALRAGLHARPGDDGLRAAIDIARSRVDYPPGIGPPPLDGVSDSVSPMALFLLSLVAGLLLVAGAVARSTGRPLFHLTLTSAACFVWAVLFVVFWLRQDESPPTVIVSKPSVLRTGDGDAFPPRLDLPLPPGVECVRLHRRGGWVQVGLAGLAADGVVGWLPEASVIDTASALRMPP